MPIHMVRQSGGTQEKPVKWRVLGFERSYLVHLCLLPTYQRRFCSGFYSCARTRCLNKCLVMLLCPLPSKRERRSLKWQFEHTICRVCVIILHYTWTSSTAKESSSSSTPEASEKFAVFVCVATGCLLLCWVRVPYTVTPQNAPRCGKQ